MADTVKSPSVVQADTTLLHKEIRNLELNLEKALARARVAEAALEAKLTPYFKRHEVVIIAAVAFLAGLAVGHFV